MAYRFLRAARERKCEDGVLTATGLTRALRDVLRITGILIVVVLSLTADVRAQTSTVIGTITYRSGKPAVNVFVSIADRYRYTDVGGRYKLDNVPQGKQRMTIKSGQRVLWEREVSISGTTTTVDRVLP